MTPVDGPPEVGVVVPARDEESALAGCLGAIARAAAHSALAGVPVRVVVVADGCVDGTAEVARAAGAEVLVREAGPGNVGIARDLGVRHLLGDRTRPDRVWVTCTDADSQVPADWLAEHLSAAGEGWDAVVGTVSVTDWSEHPQGVAAAFAGAYERWRADGAEAGHPHVHGANLGVRGSAYLDCGGFPPSAVGEDVALVEALVARGAAVLRTSSMPVATSGRLVPRAAGGFGDHLRSIVAGLPPASRPATAGRPG